MLTKIKLELYDRYYYRSSNPPGLALDEKNLMDSVFEKDDWNFISDTLFELYLANNGLASADFANEVWNKIKKQCDSDDTESYLTILSNKMHGNIT